MYIINKTSNRIQQINKKTFSSLGFTERHNLQEWIENTPDCLGEDILIIQKEFDGFSDTRERLDLLALDKEGNLIVIENKLDDSGRDVVWQALKYASYCSTLSKNQIRKIFQEYLSKKGSNSSAEEQLSEFFNASDFEELALNKHQSQRVILVANSFRKEVTSTVLWLMNYKIRIQCFKMIPYEFNENILLTVEQIIPPKDTEDYLISMASKTQDDNINQEVVKDRHHLRFEFWKKLLPMIQGKLSIFQNVNATQDHWLASGAGVSGISYHFVITKTYAAVALNIARSKKEDNKWFYDQFFSRKNELETSFGNSLEWSRMNDKKSSWIGYKKINVNLFNLEDWDQILVFLSENIISFERVFSDALRKISATAKFKIAEDELVKSEIID